MGILLWIVFGIVAGSLAKLIMPGPDRLGVLGTILLGVAGAIVGGWIGAVLGSGGVTGFDFRSLLMAIIGSLAVLFVMAAVAAALLFGLRRQSRCSRLESGSISKVLGMGQTEFLFERSGAQRA
jgi:uncharacterized membrane protein YeaQ/YmgE (transglycosylase-associated protein family)